MTVLCRRMIEDMSLRNLAPRTQKQYIDCVAAFARHCGKSPDQLGADDVRAWQLHLIQERHLSSSSLNANQCHP